MPLVDSSFILVILLLCIDLRGILSFVWMLGCRMIEAICLFGLALDCFSRCCWFLPLEYSSFGLGLKDFTFFIYCALHENSRRICLLEFACTPLTNLSPWNKIWNLASIGSSFLLFIFYWSISSLPLFYVDISSISSHACVTNQWH